MRTVFPIHQKLEQIIINFQFLIDDTLKTLTFLEVINEHSSFRIFFTLKLQHFLSNFHLLSFQAFHQLKSMQSTTETSSSASNDRSGYSFNTNLPRNSYPTVKGFIKTLLRDKKMSTLSLSSLNAQWTFISCSF